MDDRRGARAEPRRQRSIRPAPRSRWRRRRLETAGDRTTEALDPIAFVLTEPHSDHETADIAARFENAWKHYGLVFDVIDRIDLTKAEKHAMKARFFAREIEDVLSLDEYRRTERHETAPMWLARATRAGFCPYPPNIGVLPGVEDRSQPIRIAPHGDYTGLDFGNETIVANLVRCDAGSQS